MKIVKGVLLTCVALCVAGGARAQSDSLSINLDKAIEIALSDNPTIKIANMEITRTELVKKESKGSLLPNIAGTGSYNYNIMNQVMFMPEGVFGPGSGGPMRMGFSNSFTGGVSLSLPLFMPTIYKTLQLNQQQIKSAVESARASKVTLANQVKKNYYSILLAENSLEVLKRNKEYAKIIVETTRNSVNQGVSAEYDLITAEVQLSNLNPTIIATENSIRVSRLMLNMLLALPLDSRLKFEENLYTYRDANAQQNTIDLTDNSELKLLDLQMQMMDTQLKLQRAARIPTLSGVAQYNVLTQSNDLKIGHYNWKGTALAGLQLSVPLFSGFSKIHKERQIRNSIDQLSLQKDYLEDNIDVQAKTALDNMTKAQEQMIANQATIAQADKGYYISKKRYEVGSGTIVELNSAQMALLQADLNYSQSIFDYMSAKADFDQIMGKDK